MPLAPFRIRGEFEGGRTLEITPKRFAPLGCLHLQQLHADPTAQVPLQFDGNDAVFDGRPEGGELTVSARMRFTHSPAPYALVPGGWLPMPWVSPQRFLVDRNVVSALKSVRDHSGRVDQVAFAWWTGLLESGAGMFNPLPYAYEGSARRTPTRDEFVASYEEGVVELKQSFPRAQVIVYDDFHFDVAYQQLLTLAGRAGREVAFVCQAVPLVVDRVSVRNQASTLEKILELAGDLGVTRNAPVVVAILSVLFDEIDGRSPSIGRRLIKPSKAYSVEDAYNAVSDLRHIELAALGHGVLGDEPFALCTNDRAMALFWCALGIRGESTEETLLNLHYTLSHEIVPRLTDEQVHSLHLRLNE